MKKRLGFLLVALLVVSVLTLTACGAKLVDTQFTAPTKTTYQVGESLNLDGSKITYVYSNGKTESIDVIVDMLDATTVPDFATAGNFTVKGSYEDFNFEFALTVESAHVPTYSFVAPTKLVYQIGDTLDLAGAQVLVDNTPVVVTNDMLDATTIPTFTQAGTFTVTGSYNGYAFSFELTVEPAHVPTYSFVAPSKTTYFVGDTLDLTGAQVLVDNVPVAVTSQMLDATSYNMAQAGNYTVAGSYNGYDFSFQIEVANVEVTSIEIGTLPTTTAYGHRDNVTTINLAGGQVKVNYSNGTSALVELTSEMLPAEDTAWKIGDVDYTVTYLGFTTTLTITYENRALTISQLLASPVGTKCDVTGIVVGPASSHAAAELIIKDKNTMDMVGIYNTGVVGAYNNLSLDTNYVSVGDEIIVSVTVKQVAEDNKNIGSRTRIYPDAINGDSFKSKVMTVSKGNEISYDFTKVSVVEISTQDQLVEFLNSADRFYKIVKLVGVKSVAYNSNGNMVGQRIFFGNTVTKLDEQKVNGVSPFIYHQTTDWYLTNGFASYFQNPTSTKYASPATTNCNFYAMFLGGNNYYHNFVLFGNSWIEAPEVDLWQPTKTTYKVGETLDLTGASVSINGGQRVAITADMLDSSSYNMAVAGNYTVTGSHQGKTFQFAITVEEPVYTFTAPTKLTYWLGETLDLTGAQLLVDETPVAVTAEMLKSAVDMTTAGEKVVTVVYNNKEFTFKITVNAPTYTFTAPSKTTYDVGEQLSLEGGKIVVSGASQITVDLTAEMLKVAVDMTTAGEKSVVVVYDNKEFTFNVTVVDVVITFAQPTQTKFDVNEEFAFVGATLTYTYVNKQPVVVDLTQDMLDAIPATTTAGTFIVTGSYQGYAFSYTIEVRTYELSFVAPTKLVYGEGESLCMTGAKIVYTYQDGSTKEIPATIEMLDATTIPTMFEVGTFTVAGSFQTLNFSFQITIDIPTTSFVAPTKTIYNANEDLDLTGAKIVYTYSDGSTTEVAVAYTMLQPINPDVFATDGYHTIYGSYKYFEFDFQIYVIGAENHTHVYPNAGVVTAPTCTEQGYTTYTCLCGYENQTEFVPANGHVDGEVVVENNVAPTCTETGSYDNVTYCTVCKVETSRTPVTVPAKGHTSSKVEVIKATCTEYGYLLITCNGCGETFDSREDGFAKDYLNGPLGQFYNLKPTGHTDGEVVVENNVPATCTTDGSYDNVTYCTVCKVETSRTPVTVPAKGHTSSKVEVVKATCTEYGYLLITCNGCGETFDSREEGFAKDYLNGPLGQFFNLNPTGHTEETIPAVAPTYNEVGWTAGIKCSVCNEVLQAPQEVEMLPAVAKVGNVRYGTLQDAIAAAQGNDQVVLLANVQLDAPLVITTTITLDLAGFEISYTSTVQAEAMITNKGNLTINDSIGTGVINYNYVGAADSTYGKGNFTISNQGTLTVNGGKITIANLRAHAKYPIDNNSTSGDAVLVINGGHLYNYNTSAIRMFCNSTKYINSVTINGGLVEGYSAIWVQNPGANTVTAQLTVTGGEIRSTAAAYVNGTAELKDVASNIYFTTEGGNWSDASFVRLVGGIFNENVYLATKAPKAVAIGENAIFNGRLEEPIHQHVLGEVVVENEVAPTCTADGSYDNVVYCTDCLVEISRETVAIPATGHKFGSLVVTPATCTVDGYITITCSTCGLVANSLNGDQEAIDYLNSPVGQFISIGKATGHTAKEIPAVPATCTTDGLTAGSVCTTCEEVLVEQVVVPATGHRFGSLVVTPATCTVDGYITITCSNCGLVANSLNGDQEAIDYLNSPVGQFITLGKATGHTAEEIPAVPATCTETGLTAGSKCATCEEILEEQVVVPATGHRFGSLVVTPATCTVDGYITITCGNCGLVANSLNGDQEAIDYLNSPVGQFITLGKATGHTAEEIPAVPATCIQTGLTAGSKCSVCGEILTAQQVVDTTDHNAGAVVVENQKAPTHLADGSYDNVTYCTVCGVETSRETITVDKLTVTQIQLATQPTTTVYGHRDNVTTIDLTGATLSILCSNGTTETVNVTADMLPAEDTAWKLGTVDYTVSYAGFTTTLTVTYENRALTISQFLAGTVGEVYDVTGIVVGPVSSHANSELLIKDKYTSDFVSIRGINEIVGTYSALSLDTSVVNIGDEIIVSVKLVQHAADADAIGSRSRIAAAAVDLESFKQSLMILSNNNEIVYDLSSANVVEISTQAQLIAFMNSAERYYSIVKLVGVKTVPYKSGGKVVGLRIFFGTSVTSDSQQKINGASPYLYYHNSNQYTTTPIKELFEGIDSAAYASPATTPCTIHAMLLGGNSYYHDFIVLDESWIEYPASEFVAPEKTNYGVGETFDLTGATVSVKGKTASVTMDMLDESTLPNMAQAGTYTVTGSYKGFDFSFQIIVSADTITSVFTSANPTKAAQLYGKVDVTGAQITARYSLSGDVVVDVTEDMLDEYTLVVGKNLITGSYQGFEFTLEVTVTDVYTVAQSKQLKVGDTLTIRGIVMGVADATNSSTVNNIELLLRDEHSNVVIGIRGEALDLGETVSALQFGLFKQGDLVELPAEVFKADTTYQYNGNYGKIYLSYTGTAEQVQDCIKERGKAYAIDETLGGYQTVTNQAELKDALTNPNNNGVDRPIEGGQYTVLKLSGTIYTTSYYTDKTEKGCEFWRIWFDPSVSSDTDHALSIYKGSSNTYKWSPVFKANNNAINLGTSVNQLLFGIEKEESKAKFNTNYSFTGDIYAIWIGGNSYYAQLVIVSIENIKATNTYDYNLEGSNVEKAVVSRAIDNTTPATLDQLGWTAPAGYAFAGWNTKADGTGTTYTTIPTYYTKTLYAMWEAQGCSAGHTPAEAVKEKETDPDCVNAGSYDSVIYCSVCNEEISRTTVTVDALGHSEKVLDAVAPDCTNTGLTEGKQCTVCNEITVPQTTVDALGHNYVGEVTTAPTCTVDGEKTYTCTNDATHTYTEVVPATGHSYNEEVTAPTCEAQGFTTYTCTCGDSYVGNYVDALGHNYVGEVTTAPSCTVDGEKTYTCTHDATHTYTEVVPATGHTDGEVVVENNVAPTHLQAGSYDNVVKCTVCGTEISRETITVDKLVVTGIAIAVQPTTTVYGHRDNLATISVEGGALAVYCENGTTEYVDMDASMLPSQETDWAIGTVDYTITYEGFTTTLAITYENRALTVTQILQETPDMVYAKKTESSKYVAPTNVYEVTGVVVRVITDYESPELLIREKGTNNLIGIKGDEATVGKYNAPTLNTSVVKIGDEIALYVMLEKCYEDSASIALRGKTYLRAQNDDFTTAGIVVLSSGNSTDVPLTDSDVTIIDSQEDLVAFLNNPNRFYTYVKFVGINFVRSDGKNQNMLFQNSVNTEAGARVNGVFPRLSQHNMSGLSKNTLDQVLSSINGTYASPAYGKYDFYMLFVGGNSAAHHFVPLQNSWLVAHEHTPATQTSIKNNVDPTCTVDGSYDVVTRCQTCHYVISTESVTVPATGHNHVAEVTAPTCEAQGYTTHTCACGDSYVDSYVDATGHKYETTVVTAPTCTDEGVNMHKCSVCGDQYTQAVDALDHNYVGEVTTAPTCTVDGVKTYTCTNDATHTYTEAVPATGHEFGDWYQTVAPTESTKGEQRRDCKNCDHFETEELPTLDHVHNHVVEVTAPTCESQGYTTHTCDCGNTYVDNYVDALGHNYQETITQEPTHLATGIKTYTCANDASHTYTEEMPIVTVTFVAPSKVDGYALLDTIDLTGGSITFNYTHKDAVTVALTVEMLGEYALTTDGDNTITVSYEGYTNTFVVKATAVPYTLSDAKALWETNPAKVTANGVKGYIVAFDTPSDSGTKASGLYLSDEQTVYVISITSVDFAEVTYKVGDEVVVSNATLDHTNGGRVLTGSIVSVTTTDKKVDLSAIQPDVVITSQDEMKAWAKKTVPARGLIVKFSGNFSFVGTNKDGQGMGTRLNLNYAEATDFGGADYTWKVDENKAKTLAFKYGSNNLLIEKWWQIVGGRDDDETKKCLPCGGSFVAISGGFGATLWSWSILDADRFDAHVRTSLEWAPLEVPGLLAETLDALLGKHALTTSSKHVSGITWTLAEAIDGVTVENNMITIADATLDGTTIKLTATFDTYSVTVERKVVWVTPPTATVTEARTTIEVGSVITIEGLYVGVADEGNSYQKEILLKDPANDNLIAVQGVTYGTWPTHGYQKGDLVRLIVTLKQKTTGDKKYLTFVAENPATVEETIISSGNTVTYNLDEVLVLETWDDWKTNFKVDTLPMYTYVRLKGTVYLNKLNSTSDAAGGVTLYRPHANKDASKLAEIKPDGTRAIGFRENVLKANLGNSTWSNYFTGKTWSTSYSYSNAKYYKEVDITAVYTNVNGVNFMLTILEADWLK